MRVLLLAFDIDLSRNRGDSIHTLSLAKSLSRVGHKVHMVVGAAPNHYATNQLEVTVRPAGGDASVLRHILRLARAFRPDVIYERRFSPKVSAVIAGLLGIPYVVEINGIPEVERRMQNLPVPTGPVARLKKSGATSLAATSVSDCDGYTGLTGLHHPHIRRDAGKGTRHP